MTFLWTVALGFALTGAPQEPVSPARALEAAGRRAPEVRRLFSLCTDEEKRGAAFLVANMPLSDLAAFDPVSLHGEIEAAYRVRRTLPWGRQVPEDVFLHYVLPNRITQEPLAYWRVPLYLDLLPRVGRLATMDEAALAVNVWVGEHIRFVQTEYRDQGVFESLKSGYGRCEEMMILTIAAARAVGIPARPCSTPWWSTTDNNHAWVEVWTDGSWKYLGGGEPARSLNQAWFTSPARRAAFVVSTAYGLVEGEDVYRAIRNVSLINSTPVYTRTARVVARVRDAEGRPVAGANVFFTVFNYGIFRPLARITTGRNGDAELTVGLGGFFVSAGKGTARAWRFIQTEPDTVQAVDLVLDGKAVPDGRFWLRYPPKGD